ncbi:hypothetical protein BJ986_001567 [Phycicoccus badiiscoriae]|uniref:Uncharacterized protein n=1 Tax=Pedococcus badiiscoriae TaxID=642776 RepID=A0A852WEC3_9MICO|nr:hypothetical protein [Pedococcus badiiscoriae]NYG07080.1 hypothetical protein [Pedococcus badiiscoriae]
MNPETVYSLDRGPVTDREVQSLLGEPRHSRSLECGHTIERCDLLADFPQGSPPLRSIGQVARVDGDRLTTMAPPSLRVRLPSDHPVVDVEARQEVSREHTSVFDGKGGRGIPTLGGRAGLLRHRVTFSPGARRCLDCC